MYTRPGSIFNSRPQPFRITGAELQRFLLAFLWSLLILEGLHSSGCKGYNIFIRARPFSGWPCELVPWQAREKGGLGRLLVSSVDNCGSMILFW